MEGGGWWCVCGVAAFARWWVGEEVGRVGVPCTKLLENCSFGLWLLSESLCDCKGLAMFLGRMVHAFEF